MSWCASRVLTRTQAAISRLRAYNAAPSPVWDRLPARKRAAVLVLLYADRWGDLRVVNTMRAATLRSFSGHAALPGGKADHVDETPCKSIPLSCLHAPLCTHTDMGDRSNR